MGVKYTACKGRYREETALWFLWLNTPVSQRPAQEGELSAPGAPLSFFVLSFVTYVPAPRPSPDMLISVLILSGLCPGLVLL